MGWARTRSRPFIIGHRGASADAPENTLAAFALAKAQGADGIELDVQLSADGWPVVLHDFSLDRTSSGRGKVSDFSLSELQELEVGIGQNLPALAEVFEQFGSDFLYNIELKSTSVWDMDLVTAVANCVQAYRLEAQVLISSFNLFIVQQAKRKFAKETMVAHLWHKRGGRLKQNFIPVAADHPHHLQVDEAYMVWANKRSLPVNVWTVDDLFEARRLAALGVQAIITNHPQRIREGLYEDQSHS